MEWVIQLGALALCLLLAMVLGMRYEANGLSEFELQRQIKAGDKLAKAEESRRALLATYTALKTFKTVVVSVGLVALLVTTQEPWLGIVLAFAYLLLAYVVAARGWLAGVVGRAQTAGEKRVQKHLQQIAPFVAWLAPKHIPLGGSTIASRDELRQLIATDQRLLAPDDKSRLLGAFDFGTFTVADAMVPAGDIQTVDIKETVGPLLLDRLHKANHRIFVVIKKDIDHIKGLLYMHDLTPLHPELHDIKDALRPTVHYLPAQAALQDVLAASLLTGRQLFIAVGKDGSTKGLITLADALTYLCGEPLAKTAPVSTKPSLN